MNQSSFEVAGSGGRPVRGTLHDPAEPAGAPLVVIAHGFKGFRDWGFFPTLAQLLAATGLRALRIDFSHNGVEASDFDRLDLFLLDTYGRHQEDLDAVLRAVATLEAPSPRIGLLGHSRGGADVLLCAARHRQVAAVCTLAAVADARFRFADASEAERAEETLRAQGFFPVANARTGQMMPVGRPYFDDAPRHDVPGAARVLGRSPARPLLVVHGARDASVPVADAHAIANAHGAADVLVIDDADHVFGCAHPFRGPTPAFTRAAASAAAFFRRHLVA